MKDYISLILYQYIDKNSFLFNIFFQNSLYTINMVP